MKYMNSLFMILMLLSCGKLSNPRGSTDALRKDISFIQSENQCGEKAKYSERTLEIEDLLQSNILKFPEYFSHIHPVFYDYKKPLIVSLDSIQKKMESILSESDSPEKMNEIVHLFQNSQRYDDQKCSFNWLAKKKSNDIRPYMNIMHHCISKYNSETCPDNEFENLSPLEFEGLKPLAQNLCESFNEKINCMAQINIASKKRSLSLMIQNFQKRFKSERFDALFKLRSNHERYNCEKTDSKTKMTIKVLDRNFSHDFLEKALNHVSQVWKNSRFDIEFVLTNDATGAIELFPVRSGISYVPDLDNKKIYLSTIIDFESQKKVLAHEFGHVLGFPDCYIEFFDKSSNELVYYELNQKNMNIMCSMKDGVVVDESYFDQLEQNSCLFN